MISESMCEKIIAILREELVPAMGCTEPIALAFAGAKGREVLGEMPEHVTAFCSGNIVKNVRCVTIPNSGSMMGMEAAVTLGITGGDPSADMEVLAAVKQEQIAEAQRLVKQGFCKVVLLESEIPLHIKLLLKGKQHMVELEIRHAHTNIVSIKKDGVEVYAKPGKGQEKADKSMVDTAAGNGAVRDCAGEDTEFLKLDLIKEFADTIDLNRVKDLIEPQIRYNMKIAEEGLKGGYGIGIGKAILESYGDSIDTKMKAWTAAGSEARMGGCEMPVIINSGSGNQGIASSVPVIVYARERQAGEEKLYRALVFAALLTVWQKSFIGRLSAFCGAVSASCASGAALTYLDGHPIETIKMTIYNTLANTPGIICDGAKISCAAKIVSSLDAALMAHHLAVMGKSYEANIGILKEDVQDTVSCVGQIGKDGMRQTDKEILHLILE